MTLSNDVTVRGKTVAIAGLLNNWKRGEGGGGSEACLTQMELLVGCSVFYERLINRTLSGGRKGGLGLQGALACSRERERKRMAETSEVRSCDIVGQFACQASSKKVKAGFSLLHSYGRLNLMNKQRKSGIETTFLLLGTRTNPLIEEPIITSMDRRQHFGRFICTGFCAVGEKG